MENVLIRNALAEDKDTVYKFICLLEDELFDKQVFEQFFLQNIANEHYIYLLAEFNYKPIGYLSCHGQVLLHHNGWVYEIQEMYVDEEFRGKGIGKQLLDELRNRLQNKDYDMLEVTSNMKRLKTHAFYINDGFVQTHFKFTRKR